MKKNAGITLIALVVTIIVLIILAGISINLVLGENGIIKKAQEAKKVTEQAQSNEDTAINELMDQWVSLTGETNTVKAMRKTGTYMQSKTTLKDSNDNLIVVPEGFKIAEDSGINVTEGIVIEDKDIKQGIGNGRGNQYVWIPVGENIKKENKDGTIEEVDITLGRYVFADGTNHKAEDGTTVLAPGTPILKQSAENYEDETGIHITEITPTSTNDYEFKELKINRAGVASSGTDGLNATAINLKGFIDSVKSNGGYYIARYEASFGEDDGKANSKVSIGTLATSSSTTKTEGMLWNFITQIDATTASRSLYTTINSDLMNSYAWDTAIVYIQEFSEDTDYSRQDGNSINSSLTNTGVNSDEVCKINDMASNTREWTTEYFINTINSTVYPCTIRGGDYYHSSYYMSIRYGTYATDSYKDISFRPALYM